MVVTNLVHHLMEAGLTEYEAKAYIALLGQYPATAYEIARRAGIPTPKIYGVVDRLARKGVVSVSAESATHKKYLPMEPQEFTEGLRSRVNDTLTQIEGGLQGITSGETVSSVVNLKGYEYILDKSRRMLGGARRTILISAWPMESDALSSELKRAEARRVRIASVHFGSPGAAFGQLFHHPVDEDSGSQKSLVIVVDSREALAATVQPEASEGASSTNRGFVMLAEEYVKHDIYSMKLIKRYDREFRNMFGEGYEHLRDVFNDESRY